MNNPVRPSDSNTPDEPPASKKWFGLLSLLVGFEAMLVSCGAAYFLLLIFTENTANTAGAVVIFLIASFFATALWTATYAIFKRKYWVKGLIITWQVMQFAISTSFIQGLADWQLLGWAMIFLSVGTFLVALLGNNSKRAGVS